MQPTTKKKRRMNPQIIILLLIILLSHPVFSDGPDLLQNKFMDCSSKQIKFVKDQNSDRIPGKFICLGQTEIIDKVIKDIENGKIKNFKITLPQNKIFNVMVEHRSKADFGIAIIGWVTTKEKAGRHLLTIQIRKKEILIEYVILGTKQHYRIETADKKRTQVVVYKILMP